MASQAVIGTSTQQANWLSSNKTVTDCGYGSSSYDQAYYSSYVFVRINYQISNILEIYAQANKGVKFIRYYPLVFARLSSINKQ